MNEYRVRVTFDPVRQKYRARSDEVPGLDVSAMNVEKLFTLAMAAAPDLLQAAGQPPGGFNLRFEKEESA